jgi:hypothetical protein
MKLNGTVECGGKFEKNEKKGLRKVAIGQVRLGQVR